MFTSLHHFNLIVSDMEKTKEFYNHRLGLEIAMETVIEDPEFSRGVDLKDTKVLATYFKLPNNPGLIETFQYVHPEGRPVPKDAKANDGGWKHICFQVDEIEKTYKELEEKGIEFLSVPATLSQQHPHLPGARFCYFLGPDQEVIEILQA